MAGSRQTAQRLRRAITAAGGIATQAELARRWGVNRARARELTQTAGFPEPVARVGGSDVWAIAEADEWRSRRPGPGRPRKRAG